MEKIKTILLVVLVSCIVLGTAMCIFKREQTKEEMIQEYQKHEEAFEYVKGCFIANDVRRIDRQAENKITIRINGADIPLENMKDELLTEYAHLLFDDLNYSLIYYSSSTWKEDIMQLMFEKKTNKTYYYKEIIYCEDGEQPESAGRFIDMERIDQYWFYCEEDALGIRNG